MEYKDGGTSFRVGGKIGMYEASLASVHGDEIPPVLVVGTPPRADPIEL